MSAKVKIKTGALIGQDFGFFRWPEELSDMTFDVDKERDFVDEYHCVLTAYGFGQRSTPYDSKSYGNGALHVRRTEHLIFLESDSLIFSFE